MTHISNFSNYQCRRQPRVLAVTTRDAGANSHFLGQLCQIERNGIRKNTYKCTSLHTPIKIYKAAKRKLFMWTLSKIVCYDFQDEYCDITQFLKDLLNNTKILPKFLNKIRALCTYQNLRRYLLGVAKYSFSQLIKSRGVEFLSSIAFGCTRNYEMYVQPNSIQQFDDLCFVCCVSCGNF